MDAQRLNSWLAILSNVGVIVGIGLLVYEINQAREFTRIEFEANNIAAFGEVEREMMNPDIAGVWAKAALDPSSMAPTEIRVMDAFLISLFNQWRADWRLEQDGFREAGVTQKQIQASVSFYLGSTFARVWWDELKSGDHTPEALAFHAVIDEILADANPEANRDYLEKLQRAVNERVSNP